MLDQESFWNAKSFVVVTDKTKPAMKMTIDNLASIGRKVYVVDMSDKPDDGTFQRVSDIPSGADRAVIGITKSNPADVIEVLKKRGIRKFWIHWRTETPESRQKCSEPQMQCIAGRCPMMYLSKGLNIHTMHGSLMKLLGKY
jgi:hypothetical protein